MSYPFPARTLASTLAQHLDDHNTIAAILGETPFTANSTRDEHLAEHNALHPAFGLPARALGDSATFHLNDHGTIHTLLIQTYAGIRGNWGQQLNTTDVPGWPVSFTSSHSTFLSLQTAVNAAGTGRVFRITNSMTFTASLTPHTNDQFWFDPGVIITGTALTIPAFTDGGTNRTNVKFMNGTFTGFFHTLSGRSSTGWEIAYCDMTGVNNNGNCIKAGTGGGFFIHHDDFFATRNPIDFFQVTGGAEVQDCEFRNLLSHPTDSVHKIATGATNLNVRHCSLHDSPLAGIWYDFANFGCTLEWNAINNNAGFGMEWEANAGPYGTDPSTIGAGNIVRYNYVHDNGHTGISIHGSAGMDIYGNYLYRNQQLAQSGIEDSEIMLYVNSHMLGPRSADQASDLSHNNIHNNYVEVTPTIGGQQPKRGAALRVELGTFLPSATPWTSNTKLNNWYDNYYKFNRALTSTDLMLWAGTNKTWAQWQALPQDATSGAEA